MIAFILIYPLVASVLLFLFKSDILNKVVSFFYALSYLVISIIFIFIKPVELAPFFMIDSLNILFISITAVLYFGVSIYNLAYFKDSNVNIKTQTNYYISQMLFIFSMSGFMLSQHLGLNWVFIEATTLATAYLIYFDKTEDALAAAWKYIFICTIGISFAFVGIIFISKGVGGSVEQLFYSNLYRLAHNIDKFWINIGFMFIILGFGTKMGLAPMHAWLPDAHSEAPSPMSALLSGALLNTAFLGILRVYKIMVAAGDLHYAQKILMIMGFLSLIFSAAFILKTKNYKKMLAYSSIENMGIIAIGISLGGVGIFAAALHMISHSLTKASLFLTAGNILHKYGTKESEKISGLFRNDFKTGGLWFLSFLSIIAVPPFPMFISEYLIIREMIGKGWYMLAVFFVLFLTIIMFGLAATVLKMLFDKKIGDETSVETVNETHGKDNYLMYIPQIIFLLLLVIIGIYIPEPVLNIINGAVKILGM